MKLSIVMGLSWAFEVIGWWATKENSADSVAWIVLDLYNCLSGVLIFIIFICKKTVLNHLKQTSSAFEGSNVENLCDLRCSLIPIEKYHEMM